MFFWKLARAIAVHLNEKDIWKNTTADNEALEMFIALCDKKIKEHKEK